MGGLVDVKPEAGRPVTKGFLHFVNAFPFFSLASLRYVTARAATEAAFFLADFFFFP